ncbi:hypothetical protein Val02_86650 [Virgisporangium aliadipatigenens]|uniref:Uncharacterized protein n=1 Tax=Virgisporangium aliadipatigenens TaxID=741659 RepID=A0A8J3YU94_9ACTN|nr:T3SS effector HopA1 family protein [Virgisporangium aliadipatigenens]GIJ51779.1 hypothetical protein Val02_86650 [Virgisporangium aliadipatigenens]
MLSHSNKPAVPSRPHEPAVPGRTDVSSVLAVTQIAGTFAEVCGSTPPGDRNALIRRVYRRVHCRLDGDDDWSDRDRVAEQLKRATAALAGHRVAHRGFGSGGAAPDGRAVLVDAAGIRILAPRGVRVEEGSVVRVPAVGLAQEGRWLIWSGTLAPAEPGLARIYVNVKAEHTFDGWLALVRTVADAGLVAHVKCTTSTRSNARADCVIAYARPADLPRLLSLVRAALPDELRDPRVAGFAWNVERGIGAYVPDAAHSAATSSGYGWATRLVDAHRTGGIAAEFEALGRALSHTARAMGGAP